jgi:hypothetical protein
MTRIFDRHLDFRKIILDHYMLTLRRDSLALVLGNLHEAPGNLHEAPCNLHEAPDDLLYEDSQSVLAL